MSGNSGAGGRIMLMVVLSGVCISIIGVMYKIGATCTPAVDTLQVMVVAMGVGFVYSVVRLFRRPDWRRGLIGSRAGRAWVAGLINGAGQMLTAWLIIVAFQHKLPLTPVWCAMALSFVVVILYSRVVWSEKLDGAKWLSIAAAVGCVIVSSLASPSGDATEAAASSVGSVGDGGLLLAGLLVAIILCNSSSQVCMKDLGMQLSDGQTLMDRHRELFLVLMYGILTAGTVVFCVARGLPMTATSLALGLVAAAGSIAGVLLLTACVSAPAAVVFTLNGVAGILSASLISVLALGEPATAQWAATLTLAAAAIVLGSGIVRTQVTSDP